MSMPPFFPSLIPPVANSSWFDVDVPCDDEAEVTAMEREHQVWLNSITQFAMDLHPLGKTISDNMGPVDSDDEDANDDSDDSESHDDEDEDEMDGIDASRETLDRDGMETNYALGDARREPNTI